MLLKGNCSLHQAGIFTKNLLTVHNYFKVFNLFTSSSDFVANFLVRYGVNMALRDFFTAGLSGVAKSSPRKPPSLAHARKLNLASWLATSCTEN